MELQEVHLHSSSDLVLSAGDLLDGIFMATSADGYLLLDQVMNLHRVCRRAHQLQCAQHQTQ